MISCSRRPSRTWRRPTRATWSSSPRLVAALACWAALGLGPGCSRSSDKPAPDEQAADEASPALASFALGYAPGPDEAALASAQERVRARPDSAAAYVALAEAFIARKRETGEPAYMGYAQDALRGARRLAPDDVAVRTTEIMFLLGAHRFAEAAEAARAVAAASPRDATGYLLESDALLELGDYPGAVAALERAMERAPDLRSYSRAGYLRWLHGDVEGALEIMGEAIAAGSRTAEPVAWCHVELGVMRWHQGNVQGAQGAAERALALVPDYVPALRLRARVLVARERPGEAIAVLEDVAGRVPTAETLLQLAELLAAQGERGAAAAKYLARAEELAAHDPLPLAVYYARHGKEPARALALAEKAVAERATIYTQDALALALLRNQRVDEAARVMARARALGTPDARLLLHHGLIERAAGRVDAARAALERALAQNPHADPLLAAELARALEAP